MRLGESLNQGMALLPLFVTYRPNTGQIVFENCARFVRVQPFGDLFGQ